MLGQTDISSARCINMREQMKFKLFFLQEGNKVRQYMLNEGKVLHAHQNGILPAISLSFYVDLFASLQKAISVRFEHVLAQLKAIKMVEYKLFSTSK